MLIEDRLIRKFFIETKEEQEICQKYLDECWEKGIVQSLEYGMNWVKITTKEVKEYKE